MPIATSHEPEDPEPIRAKLKAMSDAELVKHGRALRIACDPSKGFVSPGTPFELRESRLEWLRRREARRNR